ncbi:MAG: S-layer homology domain-containing protein [Candidatus Sericytochromatia bacterium]|nr:S-layer homology domain-containing protein [Candidatus Sericytochromatia bacterium]
MNRAIRRLLASGVLLAAVPALSPVLPASAAPRAQPGFSDVPPDHWAAEAVRDVAVRSRLMPAEGGRFRGELPLTRLDLARTVGAFIREIEAKSGRKLSDSAVAFVFNFGDIDEASLRKQVEALANQYNLFDYVPEVEVSRFQPRRPVVRTELAAVLAKMVDLLQKQALLPRSTVVEPTNPFSDLSPLDKGYDAVLATVVKYQILTGYSDGLFRGDREVTRYEFASAAAKAFDALREQLSGKVRSRLPEQLVRDPGPRWRRETPWAVSLGALVPTYFRLAGNGVSMGVGAVADPTAGPRLDTGGLGVLLEVSQTRYGKGATWGSRAPAVSFTDWFVNAAPMLADNGAFALGGLRLGSTGSNLGGNGQLQFYGGPLLMGRLGWGGKVVGGGSADRSNLSTGSDFGAGGGLLGGMMMHFGLGPGTGLMLRTELGPAALAGSQTLVANPAFDAALPTSLGGEAGQSGAIVQAGALSADGTVADQAASGLRTAVGVYGRGELGLRLGPVELTLFSLVLPAGFVAPGRTASGGLADVSVGGRFGAAF